MLAGLKERLLTPEMVAEAARVFVEEAAAANKKAGQKRAGLERQAAEVERSLAGILRAIEVGAWSTNLRDRLSELERGKDALTAERTWRWRPECRPAPCWRRCLPAAGAGSGSGAERTGHSCRSR